MAKSDSHISYYAHHSSWGSYASFVMGYIGKGGGFILGNVQPPSSNIYIGYKKEREIPKFLPFYSDEKSGLGMESYTGAVMPPPKHADSRKLIVFREEEIRREMKWATDTWIVPGLRFTLITPFGKMPEMQCKPGDEEARFFLNPVIFARIEFDNTDSNSSMTGIFVLQGMRRILSDIHGPRMKGVALQNKCGFALCPAENNKGEVHEVLGWDILNEVFTGDKVIKRLGFEGGLEFMIKPGVKETFTLVMASFQDGVITTNKPMQFGYTRYFSNLDETLLYGIGHAKRSLAIAEERDRELSGSGLSSHRQFLVAHASHSYLASTEFLIGKDEKPVFVVNEGEYQMMNTMDLLVDQLFWELRFTPWTVRNELDFYRLYYSYTDEVKTRDGKESAGGISFCHDEGVADMFTPHGSSSYELADKTGCFSHMTSEQLVNWAISASLYGILSPDDDWLHSHEMTFADILDSLLNRDLNDDGIMDADSIRCISGSEITTYDSLDVSLGQARNNLYLAVKTWAAYLCIKAVFSRLGHLNLVQKAETRAIACAGTISSKFIPGEGYIPAVFENGNTSRIIPAIEGLIYPYMINDRDAVSLNGRFGGFISRLKTHLETILAPGVCLDPESGGWKLSSTSRNTWMSKIFLNQFIAKEILGYTSDLWDEWDRIHASWQTDRCSLFAATDQVESDTGKDHGSRLYPRLVTSILWLKK